MRQLAGLRLNELTLEERAIVFVPGTVLEYSDMANLPRQARIVGVGTTNWGPTVVLSNIGWTPGWIDGEISYLSLDGGFQHGWKVVSVGE